MNAGPINASLSLRAARPLLFSTRLSVIFCLKNIAFAMFHAMFIDNDYQVHFNGYG
ncbi:hypothetical protein BH222_002491 [Salmonella enterica subsp. enterica serovar Saintpaul]|uniref:Uncharacterized protein n=2 Tax=Salmonella enterica I TaxID=59201 RepID=A0A735MX03_SALET|nr:hypothetical protein [Salmonella enterica subsp. enterica serovar Saintpaul]EDN6507513.1 hypothetical protein [Salmonella enterica]EDT2130766.1 hypothetical protein [Salmonella enterica subsp. enterica]HAE8461386.1 hypothetical protein [Salmonella enterica subsp. enterica serovar Sendai]EDN6922915.1 hypothetical protein [Salmonella enterica]